jgi:hypothetical protein
MNCRQIVWLATREASDFLYRLLWSKKEIKREIFFARSLVLGNQEFWVEYGNGMEGPLELERKMVEYIDTLEELWEEWGIPMVSDRLRSMDGNTLKAHGIKLLPIPLAT